MIQQNRIPDQADFRLGNHSREQFPRNNRRKDQNQENYRPNKHKVQHMSQQQAEQGTHREREQTVSEDTRQLQKRDFRLEQSRIQVKHNIPGKNNCHAHDKRAFLRRPANQRPQRTKQDREEKRAPELIILDDLGQFFGVFFGVLVDDVGGALVDGIWLLMRRGVLDFFGFRIVFVQILVFLF